MNVAAAKPKYAPWVKLLAEDREHFSAAAAPAYWRLAPHYVGQVTESCCAIASATMVANALCGGRAGEKLLTQHDVIEAAADDALKAATMVDGGGGASRDRLADLLARVLPLVGAGAPRIRAVPVTAADGPLVKVALAEVEAGRSLMIAHFLMEPVIGEGDYGHFSPVGAWDAARGRVLILDVYRVSYEPYWVPFDRLMAGMATRDKVEGKPRGFIAIDLA